MIFGASLFGQSIYPHGFEHQIDSECRRCGGRGGMGLAGRRIVGRHRELSGRAIASSAKVQKDNMTSSATRTETLSADEQAAAIQARVEGWQLFWRFVWSAALIVSTVGVATVIAHWAEGPI
jgi:predicted lysophospholipase L1 biosynthesis ABC-type transport system permease subunit